MNPGTNTTIVSQIIPVNRTYAPIQAFVDELRRCGLAHAVTCPGSRNAPLILTLAGQDGIDAISVIDERAAGFLALGLAKASGKPVAVTCTSGTAAANLHPAVAEACEARVPLIVLTADRPPELREHSSAPDANDVQRLADRIAATPRGAIVCGPTREDVAEVVARLAGEAGWPVLAEPTSGLRCGGHDRSHVVAHYDVLLRVEAFTQEHLPALVLRVGDTPTSKPLRELLARTEQVILDPDAAWHEPTRSAGLLLHAAA